jgi:hypothetical protein
MLVANTLLSVVLISAFIGIFFFTYASYVENEIVKVRSEEIINDLTNTILTITPRQQRDELNRIITPYLVPPNLAEEDKKVEESNTKLRKEAFSFIVIFFILGFSIFLVLSYYFKFSAKRLVHKNLIILFFVALTEFCFLTFFAKHYITIDSNFIKYKVLDTIMK